MHADVNSLHQQVIARVQKFEAEAMAANVAPQHVASARYAICTALDETVLRTPWGSESVWSTHSLLTTFHQEAWGGEKFFQILDRVKTDIMANIDLLEVMYLCLSLGFEGKYKIQERGHVQIASVRDELYRLIRQARGEIERGLAPNWRGVEDKRNPLARYVPLWVVATVERRRCTGHRILERGGRTERHPAGSVAGGTRISRLDQYNGEGWHHHRDITGR
jgi:type VI secretion system protein ImpK